MLKNIKKILELLSPSERNSAIALLAIMLLSALMDVLGVASILPFMAVLANPSLIETNVILNRVYMQLNHFGVYSQEQFMLTIGITVFLLLIASLATKSFLIFAQTRFSLMREYSIGMRLVEGYLRQPYSWFLNKNSSDLGKMVLSEVQIVIVNGIIPLMTLVAQCFVVIGLLTLLYLVDKLLALTVGAVLGLSYAAIFLLMRGRLKSLGHRHIEANQQRFLAVGEAFGAIREIKVAGLEDFYSKRFSSPAEKYANGQAVAQLIGNLPRYAIEAVAFGGLLLIILYLMSGRHGFAEALPIISLYAFAGYRIMPAIQQIYNAVTQLKFVGPALHVVHEDIISYKVEKINQKSTPALVLNDAIRLENVVYSYPNAQHPALNHIDLIIPLNNSVGIVGATGSGKSTALDVVLGLLNPQEGYLTVDNVPITNLNVREWQREVGYVPQHIYLADDSVAANIAFGVNAEKIDWLAVENAAKFANLHDFVVNELPEGYATRVGERGVRLSGGQRQRIGIARALYHKPQVLVWDEATSALDNVTEQAVMEAISKINHQITIVMVAHRLSTVRHCDNIYLLKEGSVMASGTYNQLLDSSTEFANMVKNG